MPKRILLIDDEPDIARLIQITLPALAGWQVLVASSGPEGIQLAIEHQPDAILLDVMMPDMDGQETCQILCQNAETKRIPVILLTAKIRSATISSYDHLGVAGCIAKPFNATELASVISALLNWHSS